MLELTNLSRHFGGVRAVDALDLQVRRGEILGLIGPNGSGKSTTVNLIAGLYKPTSGTLAFEGRDIGALATHERAWLGIARTFQNIRLFGHLSVWQNIWAARIVRERGWAGFRQRWLAGARAAREEAESMLAFSGLSDKRDMLAGNLAFGEQRRLELARAAASGASLLLLDEPAAGMNAEEIDDLDERIRKLRDAGRTILLIEHHMELVMGVCDRVAVLNFGRKIAEGTPAEVQNDAEVRAAADQYTAAQLAGIPVSRVQRIAFAFACALSGLAAFTVLSLEGQVTPMFGMWVLIKGLVAAMLGGLGSITGVLAGGLLLGVVEAHAQAFLGAIGREFATYALLFVALVIPWRHLGLASCEAYGSKRSS